MNRCDFQQIPSPENLGPHSNYPNLPWLGRSAVQARRMYTFAHRGFATVTSMRFHTFPFPTIVLGLALCVLAAPALSPCWTVLIHFLMASTYELRLRPIGPPLA